MKLHLHSLLHQVAKRCFKCLRIMHLGIFRANMLNNAPRQATSIQDEMTMFRSLCLPLYGVMTTATQNLQNAR